MSRLPLDILGGHTLTTWENTVIYMVRLRPGFQPLIFLCTTFGKQGTPIVYLALKNAAPLTYLLTESLLYVK